VNRLTLLPALLTLLVSTTVQAQESPAELNARGDAIYLAKDGRSRLAEAARLYVAACEGGDAQGCINAGYVTRRGDGVTVELAKAGLYYRKACDLGEPWGCLYLREVCADADLASADACKGIDVPPYAAPEPRTFNNNNTSGLSRTQIKVALVPIEREARQRCAAAGEGSAVIRVRMAIAPNGRVVQAVPSAANVSDATVACVVKLLRKARFPTFSGSTMMVAYPFRL